MEVISIQNRPNIQQTVGEHTYARAPFNLAVHGQVDDLVTFLAALEESQQPPLVVRTAQLSEAKVGTLLTMEMDLYSRPAGMDAPSQAGAGSPQPGAAGR